MADFIYIVEAQNGLIKIGCSGDPKARLATMRLYCPVLVRLVALWESPRGDELDIHETFRDQRSHKEWFRVEGPVVDFLSEVWGKGVTEIPGWHELTFANDEGKSRLVAGRSERAKAMWIDPEWRARWHDAQKRNSANSSEVRVA